MKLEGGHSYNGGSWNYGGQHQEGWYYAYYGQPGTRRSAEVNPKDPFQHTLLNGTVVELDGIVTVEVDAAEPQGYKSVTTLRIT
jgi:hypothetical protein